MKSLIKIIFAIIFIALILFGAAFAFLPLPGTIPVLMYHFIDTPERAAKEKNVVSRQSFERQMEFLHRFGYRIISLNDFYEIQTGKKKPEGRQVVITFDDGNYTFDGQAFPILKKYSFPVAAFVVSESVKRETNGSMSEAILKKLLETGLVTIGSHTKTHPLLSRMNDEQIKDELTGSKQDLEAMFGVPVLDLAYPSGDVDERVLRLAKEAGYRVAFTTSYKKLKGLEEGPYTLGRIKITRTSDNLLVFWFKLSGIYNSFKHLRYEMRH